MKKREPEILADAPRRIEPGQHLPLLLLAKDAHHYPCTLIKAHGTLKSESGLTRQIEILPEPVNLKTPYWWKVFYIEVEGYTGWVELDVALTINAGGKNKTYRNDNYRTSSHKPLRVFVDSEPLPSLDGLFLGDAHTHSSYTEDQVEYGAPLEASRTLCRAMGLSFFCATDHSYDLDDKVDNYLENDPSLPKWHALQQEVATLNGNCEDFIVVRGEEATVRNAAGENVHLLLLGNRTFVPGSGDSAERWLHTRSEHAILDVLALKDDNTVRYAAHPKEKVPLLQRVLLGRGSWAISDLRANNLTGIQIANGAVDEGFREGYHNWVRLLLEGMKLFIIAGNDAHGNYNRFRQLQIPFLKLREMDVQTFGKIRTGVFFSGALTEDALLGTFASGCMIISDGPVAAMHATGNPGERGNIGGTITCKDVLIELRILSNLTMGWISSARIFLGVIGADYEKLIMDVKSDQKHFQLEETLRLTIDESCYVRAEVWTSAEQSFDRQEHFCMTNPIWLSPR
ncbi:MAG: hypothetical protein WEE20_12045 [Bacteroidota bacterium]